MRPTRLNPYFRPLASLKGVGPRLDALFARLLGRGEGSMTCVIDLLLHRPSGLIDRSNQPLIMEAEPGAVVTLKVTVGAHRPPPPGNRRTPYRVDVFDDSGAMALVFFKSDRRWLENVLPVGAVRYVSGKIEIYQSLPQMPHPDHIVDEAGFAQLTLLEPVYPLTGGLGRKAVQRTIASALEAVRPLDEWQDAAWLRRRDWQTFDASLRAIHHPRALADLDLNAPALGRLAYDELLASQLALALMRTHMKKSAGVARIAKGRLRQQIISHLAYTLTGAQERAVREIVDDLASRQRMLRLLQGDVGAGKTIVAVLAMVEAAEAGGQAALMAPTDLLVRQHAATITPLCEAVGLTCAVLTGRDKGQKRAAIIERLAKGQIDILLGTHALFQSGVTFADLALAVIDEQHRFGVNQRLALSAKGLAPDLLVMTATPIPRSLVLSYFGDMDVSQLTEKPPHRQPITTRTVNATRIEDVVGRLGKAISAGAQAYWVCPLIEDSEALLLVSAEARYQALCRAFGKERVRLVHGRMDAREKDAAMDSFIQGKTKILVATTVIEVGVDVANATIMIIEHAERFGVAQLHQLRGRVGRSDQASSCILVYSHPLSETARARLAIMRETEDGFRIAEEDLRLRGEGEILGTRQSGAPDFRIADAGAHGPLLEAARRDAKYIIETDPGLTSARGAALRLLLYLFRLDDAVKLFKAG